MLVNLLAKIIATFRPLGLLQAMLTKLNNLTYGLCCVIIAKCMCNSNLTVVKF